MTILVRLVWTWALCSGVSGAVAEEAAGLQVDFGGWRGVFVRMEKARRTGVTVHNASAEIVVGVSATATLYDARVEQILGDLPPGAAATSLS